MLSPEARTVAVDFLRPPPRHRFDRAVITTYSLDLEALLALPLATLAHADSGLDELMADPLLLLQALRETGDQIQVFVDEAGIAVPRVARGIYAMLESSVHPVRAPNGGAFHPKIWFVRFLSEDDAPLLRIAILSRNLTFDRSWDVALASEAAPAGRRRKASSRSLGDFLRALPEMGTQTIPESVATAIMELALEVERCEFPAPDPFNGAIEYRALGLRRLQRRRLRLPTQNGSRLIAISPFLSSRTVQALTEKAYDERTLIGRQDELDRLSEAALADWDHKLVLSQQVGAESADDAADRPDGLHAKVIGIEHGWDVSWYVGSANATNAGYNGHNVECVASLTGRRSRVGIKKFAEAGFINICEPYRRIEPAGIDAEVAAARDALEHARKSLVADGALRVECTPRESDWILTLTGNIELPAGINVIAWPLSLREETGQPLCLPLTWRMPTNLLTAFIAFRLSVQNPDVNNIRLALLLPASGLPENRMMHVLRSLIDSPERFMRFLRALLGGFDGLLDEAVSEGNGGETTGWSTGLGGESLLEDLMRIAARQPARLEPIRKLIEDLRATEEGRLIVPDDFLQIWDAVNEAVAHDRVAAQRLGTASRSGLDPASAKEADS